MVTLFRTLISGPDVTGGGVCSLYFTDAPDDDIRAEQMEALDTFWTTVAYNSDSGVTFEVEGTQPRYAASTGQLQEVYSVPSAGPHVGGQSGSAVPRASQALIRWKTSEVVGGRLLQGRTFLPGVVGAASTDTGLTAAGAVHRAVPHDQGVVRVGEQLRSRRD